MVTKSSGTVVIGKSGGTDLKQNRNGALGDFAGFIVRLVELIALVSIGAFGIVWCREIDSIACGVLSGLAVISAGTISMNGLLEGIDLNHKLVSWTAVIATTVFAMMYVPARDPAGAESKTPVVAFRGKTNIGHRLWVVPFSKDTVVLKDFEAKTEVRLGNGHVATTHGKFAIVPDESRVLAAVRIGDPEGRMRNIAEKTLASAVRMALTCPNRLDRNALEDATLIHEHERDLPMRVSGSVSAELLLDTLTSRPASCE